MHLFLVCMPQASLFSHVPNTQWVREICLWTSWWSKFVKKHCGLAAVTPWCLGHQARRAPLRSEHWVRTWCCHQLPAKKQNGRTRVPPWKTGVQKIYLEDEPLARHVSTAEGNSSQINLLLEKWWFCRKTDRRKHVNYWTVPAIVAYKMKNGHFPSELWISMED